MNKKVNLKALLWHTRYMIERHYRNRWLTNRLTELIEAAECAVNNDCFANQERLVAVIESARYSVRHHGYVRAQTAKVPIQDSSPT